MFNNVFHKVCGPKPWYMHIELPTRCDHMNFKCYSNMWDKRFLLTNCTCEVRWNREHRIKHTSCRNTLSFNNPPFTCCTTVTLMHGDSHLHASHVQYACIIIHCYVYWGKCVSQEVQKAREDRAMPRSFKFHVPISYNCCVRSLSHVQERRAWKMERYPIVLSSWQTLSGLWNVIWFCSLT